MGTRYIRERAQEQHHKLQDKIHIVVDRDDIPPPIPTFADMKIPDVMLKYLKSKRIVHPSNCRCRCRSLRNWNWNWRCHCPRNWLSLNWNGLNPHWNWQLEGTISTGESTRESGQGLPLAHREPTRGSSHPMSRHSRSVLLFHVLSLFKEVPR